MAITLLVMFIAGCVHTPAGLAPSTSPIAVPEGQEMVVLGHAVGHTRYFSLFFYFPFGRPHYDTAIKNAMSQFHGGQALISVQAWSTKTYAFIGWVHTLHVEGDVVGYKLALPAGTY